MVFKIYPLVITKSSCNNVVIIILILSWSSALQHRLCEGRVLKWFSGWQTDGRHIPAGRLQLSLLCLFRWFHHSCGVSNKNYDFIMVFGKREKNMQDTTGCMPKMGWAEMSSGDLTVIQYISVCFLSGTCQWLASFD